MTNNYRIDYQTETIMEYSMQERAYLFLCTFRMIGATKSNRESTIIKKIKASSI